MEYQNKIKDGNEKLLNFNSHINIENLSFGYLKDNEVIQNFSLKIKKGQKIGICGSSGCGKSTLLKLLFRFYDPSKGGGRIYMDGVGIQRYNLQSYRDHIGYIHQDPYIFDGTIEENLLYANRNSSELDIINACKKASIYEFIMSLKDKFDTKVGPRGMKLSGGQKQRLAIARIFLKDPDIILLDEATSALDNATEKVVQESLDYFKNKTQIIVAHRLSTIMNSDKIILMGENTTEEGTHDELIELKGEYYNLYNRESKDKEQQP